VKQGKLRDLTVVLGVATTLLLTVLQVHNVADSTYRYDAAPMDTTSSPADDSTVTPMGPEPGGRVTFALQATANVTSMATSANTDCTMQVATPVHHRYADEV
jgi:hypothetical protein